MAKQASEDRPLHDALLDDVDQMLTLYDASVQHLLEAIRHDGYFDDIDPDALIWPKLAQPRRSPECFQQI